MHVFHEIVPFIRRELNHDRLWDFKLVRVNGILGGFDADLSTKAIEIGMLQGGN